ncbi:TPA: M48 family metallopeptidase [Campylobacter jejuni]|uniref:M48 family metallopeptidase n=3 Tax=Campylobacter jejuni TaxID=197 RepID=A0A5Z1H6B9_CAMJU|nr:MULTISPECIES: M48 family metallopeptidase [Campylobacter]EAK5450812.1 M48 family metallopeptidase [Campylobacter hyointestinalis]ETJ81807.1 peptidase M48 [Campylobacter jejuni subsp. jejuni 81-176-DRH212]WPM67385.1 M48 family metallopeptidase [Campylobacter sp. CFSAN122778]AHY39952.1 M48 family peptidase [Campylobacter jejuni subsp. jejuni CG8421]ANS23781.1 peptidase, M48 family [Campylobacter jejuni subsp. jejuni]
MTLIAILCLYTALLSWISYAQIRFLEREKDKQAQILSEKDYQNAADIAIENEKFKLFSNFYNLIISIAWIGFGFLYLKELLILNNTRFENTLFLLSFLIITSILNLPLSIYESFIKDKAHGFSNMTVKLFIKDTMKSLILTLIFGFLILYALLFCYDFFGTFWWIAAFIFAFCIIVIINLIYPTLIAPIFNKMEKLDDENLLKKISSLMKQCGFSANGVYVIDASKRDKRLNAYFGGLFKSKRVVLFDTLLKALNERELLAVLGHELGHFVHKDIIKALFNGAITMFLLFFVFANLPEFVYLESHLEGVNGGVFALLFIFANIFSFLISPMLNALSRKNEFAADQHGAKVTSKEDMKNALIALARENKAFIKTSKIYTFFYLSHPSISDRIKALS